MDEVNSSLHRAPFSQDQCYSPSPTMVPLFQVGRIHSTCRRAVAPAIAASLFSFSLENNIMGGYGVFYAPTLFSLAAV